VGGRFWLPSRQEIEIRRNGQYLDYPVRGIISGRWEIGDYHFNLNLAPSVFAGPEIVQATPAELRQHVWTGQVLDSLPPGVRAVSDDDIRRVQAEARELVRARALERAGGARVSAGRVSDFVRFDRVEGLALGGGVAKPLGNGVTANVRARYGIDDEQVKGVASVSKIYASGTTLRFFGSRDYRSAGDVDERSSVVNSVAAQEFGSDYTDPFLVRAVGLSAEFSPAGGWHARLTGAYERQSPLSIRAKSVVGTFAATLPVADVRTNRLSLELDRPPLPWMFGTELTVHAETRVRFLDAPAGSPMPYGDNTLRGAFTANIERSFGVHRLITATTVAGLATRSTLAGREPIEELAFFGGPISGPGYDYHSLAGRAGFSEHLEWRTPVPFPAFSLGRFGRVPTRAGLAPFLHVVGISRVDDPFTISGQLVNPPSLGLDRPGPGLYPSAGVAYLLPFDLLRFQVARGLARGGRWTFNVDLSREFWQIL
jgi:hypothetical protein